MNVWNIRGKIIGTVLCSAVYCTVMCATIRTRTVITVNFGLGSYFCRPTFVPVLS